MEKTTTTAPAPPAGFTSYQKFVIAILAFLQFTVVLDFVVLSPLGAQMTRILNLSPAQFGLVVSAYAFSAGIAGFLAAGFADKFDRKKLLIFFYAGFILGTVLCGIAPGYYSLLGARIVTGVFGGVLSSVTFAIVTDLFVMQQRGRVMGFVQMAFAASQVLGIPVGLYLADKLSWHAPFLLISAIGFIVGIFIVIYLRPIDEHLKVRSNRNPFMHLLKTLTMKRYMVGFGATALLSIGGFMLMPFSSQFLVNNVGIPESKLAMVFMITGLFAMATGPLVGKLSDKVGKYPIFIGGSIITTVGVLIYTQLGITPLVQLILVNVIIFIGVSSRMISAGAMTTGIPALQDRGAFMGINSSIQQVAGGVASVIGGLIIGNQKTGPLHHFDWIGYIISGTVALCLIMFYFINRMIKRDGAAANQAAVADMAATEVKIEA
jgi:predicted MFS family arabinose efflux permease